MNHEKVLDCAAFALKLIFKINFNVFFEILKFSHFINSQHQQQRSEKIIHQKIYTRRQRQHLKLFIAGNRISEDIEAV